MIGPRIPRDNNFDLIRLLAALQVVFSHSTTHLSANVPSALNAIVSLFPGVPIFFFISGLLVTSSLAGRSLRSYAEARCRRVFPALWLAFALALLILALFRQLELSSKLALWAFTQVTVFQLYNPDMFRDFGVGVVNGSLWTIPVEIGFYCALPLLVWASRGSRRALTSILIGSALLSFGIHTVVAGSQSIVFKLIYATPLAHLWLFALGALAYIHFDILFPLVRRTNFLIPIGIYIVFGLLLGRANPAAELVATLLLTASVFSLGLAAPSVVRVLRGNDLSYGIYLFHMLAVNVLVETGHFGWGAVCIAAASAIAMAWCSWTFVESRALGRRPTQSRPLKPAEVAP
jgi:peptidoglycan/LPS O-acetylase OafA/YrhL